MKRGGGGSLRGPLGYRIWDLLHVYKQTNDGSSGKELSRTDGRTDQRTDERAVSTRRTWTLTTAGVKNTRKVWTENRKVCPRLLSSLLDSKPVFHSGNFESNLTLPQYTRKVSAKWINTRTWDSRRASLSTT